MLSFVSMFFLTCNAPHYNPLDPENPDNKLISIEGKIESASKTPQSLKDVIINWKNENLFVKTDENGLFKIQTNNFENGWICFEKVGFQYDSLFLNRNNQNNFYFTHKLNQLPVLDSIYVYSVVRNKFSKPEYLVNFEITVSDPDDEIDTVYIKNNALSIYKRLQKLSSKYFEGRFYDYELNLTSLEEVIGKEFKIEVISNTKRYIIGGTNIKRIINEEIETIAPKNSDTISVQELTLRWKRFVPGFLFNYQIEIYTDETEPILKWKKENVSSEDISILVDTTLNQTPDNSFFWVIWCIDEFKNKTRAKPAGFIIKQ